jgi:hypothetical protein
MLTQSEARSLAEAYLKSLALEDDVVILPATIERPFGWVFFWQSREFVETGNPGAQLAGNAPLIVNRHDRSISPTGTALPIESYIVSYEASHDGKVAS